MKEKAKDAGILDPQTRVSRPSNMFGKNFSIQEAETPTIGQPVGLGSKLSSHAAAVKETNSDDDSDEDFGMPNLRNKIQ